MVFLDTEFTDLACPALLSFSMVSLDRLEIHAELDLGIDGVGPKRLSASSSFTRTAVIPQFGRLRSSVEPAAQRRRTRCLFVDRTPQPDLESRAANQLICDRTAPSWSPPTLRDPKAGGGDCKD